MKNSAVPTIVESIFLRSLLLVNKINPFLDLFFKSTNDIILCYHDISDDNSNFTVSKNSFIDHIKTLSKKFDIVPLDKILIRNKYKNKAYLSLTFDDGNLGLYNNAYPVLEQYNVVGTVFVIGGEVENSKKNSTNFLAIDEIKKLKSKKWEIGYHTNSHTKLNTLTEEQLLEEIVNSKKVVEKKLGFKLSKLAYPYGIYNSEAIKIAKKGGYTAAFNTSGSYSNKYVNPLEVSRITVTRYMDKRHINALTSPAGVFLNRIFTFLWRAKDNFLQND